MVMGVVIKKCTRRARMLEEEYYEVGEEELNAMQWNL